MRCCNAIAPREWNWEKQIYTIVIITIIILRTAGRKRIAYLPPAIAIAKLIIFTRTAALPVIAP